MGNTAKVRYSKDYASIAGEQQTTFENVLTDPEVLQNGALRIITQSSPTVIHTLAPHSWGQVSFEKAEARQMAGSQSSPRNT